MDLGVADDNAALRYGTYALRGEVFAVSQWVPHGSGLCGDTAFGQMPFNDGG